MAPARRDRRWSLAIMPEPTYHQEPIANKPLVWMHGEIKTPPFSLEARVESGFLLRRLQRGETLSFPHSRPLSSVDPKCLELRIEDRDESWRIVCAVEADAIVILDVFSKKTRKTPERVLATCKKRLARYRRL